MPVPPPSKAMPLARRPGGVPAFYRSVLAFGCALVLQGCVAPQLPTHPPVPPVLAETVPAPPPSRIALIWRPGHYDWDGAQYAWRAGEWVDRAGHGTLWQDGYWTQSGGRAAWVQAHWI